MVAKDKNYPCEGRLKQKIEEFYKLCDRFNLVYPDIEQSEGNQKFTSPNIVRITEDVDIENVFGHFMCEYYYIEPDVIATAIAKMINESNIKPIEMDPVKAAFQHNLGLYR